MNGGFYSANEAAAALGISPPRVRQLCQAGKIKAVKLGAWAWAISAAEVEKARKRKTIPGPEPEKKRKRKRA